MKVFGLERTSVKYSSLEQHSCFVSSYVQRLLIELHFEELFFYVLIFVHEINGRLAVDR